MSNPDIKEIAMSGFADSMRRAPIVYALVLEALIIGGLSYLIFSDHTAARKQHEKYVQELHEELVACHRRGRK